MGGSMYYWYRSYQHGDLGYQFEQQRTGKCWSKLLGIKFKPNNEEYAIKISNLKIAGGKRVVLTRGIYDQWHKTYNVKGYPYIHLCCLGVNAILKTKNRKSMTLYFKRVK